jgi:uncharacterized protein (DUF1015 family)
MAVFLPFSAVHYNQNKFPKITDLISPPFDMIDSKMQDKLMKEYYNFIQLILPSGEDSTKYKSGAHKLFGWLLRDVLIVDKTPSYYIHEQNTVVEGIEYKKYGIIGLLKIEEYGKSVKKHEKSLDHFVNDRYLLLKEAQSVLENIFCLYKDKENTLTEVLKDHVKKAKSFLEFQDNTGSSNKIYKVDDEAEKKNINVFFNDKAVYIADGHHRYEAALRYQIEMKNSLGSKYTGKEPFNYVMVDFFNAYDKALQILYVNRMIKKLNKSPQDILKQLNEKFKIAVIQFDDLKMEKLAREKMRKVLTDNKAQGAVSFGLYLKAVPNRYFVMVLKEANTKQNLDVEILETQVIGPILGIEQKDYENDMSYDTNDQTAFDNVKSGEYSMSFFLNPININTVLDYSDKGNLMPNKTTNFYPKVLSGMTVFSYRFSNTKL